MVPSENICPYNFKSIHCTLESLTLKPCKTVSQTACEFLEQKYLLFCLFPLIFKEPDHTTTVPQHKINKQTSSRSINVLATTCNTAFLLTSVEENVLAQL